MHSYPCKRLQIPLGKKGWKINSINFWQCTRVLPQRDLDFPSFKGLWICKLSQVWELMKRPWLFAFIIHFIFCFLDLELFCFYRSSKNLVGFQYASIPGAPWLTGAHIWLQESNYSDCCCDSAVHYSHNDHFGGWMSLIGSCYPKM